MITGFVVLSIADFLVIVLEVISLKWIFGAQIKVLAELYSF